MKVKEKIECKFLISKAKSLRLRRRWRSLRRTRGTCGYHYYLKDYLGNNRDVIRSDDNAANWTHLQRTEYTPFGLSFPQTVGDAAEQPYKFGGKELDRMHGLNYYDFLARMYDPVLISFATSDPLCEKYYSISPYAYGLNNPVRFTDPTGMGAIR